VTSTLDGDDDILWALVEVTGHGQDFDLILISDHDSPLSLALEKGAYFVIVGTYERRDEYRLVVGY